MDDVSLKQKQTAEDKDLDNLIFSEKQEAAASKENDKPQQDGDSDDSDDKKSATSNKSDRSSLSNVLPVDKLKNGATTASKVLGQTYSLFREKSSAALETAKSSNAGKTLERGLNTATTAGSEQYGKLKETEAFKKGSTYASAGYERTSTVASGALERVRGASTAGLEMAKHSAAAGYETIKSKTSGKKGD